MKTAPLFLALLLIVPLLTIACAKDEDGGGSGGSSKKLDRDGDGKRRYPWGPDFDDDNDAAMQEVLGGRDVNDADSAIQTSLNVGTFTAGTNVAVGQSPRGIDSADFNNDGNIDVVTADQDTDTVSVMLGDGTGALGTASSISLTNSGYTVCACDTNNDGKIDIVVGKGGGLSVMLGNGNGTFGAEIPDTNVTQSVVWIVAADFNGDDNLDLAVVDSNGISSYFVRCLLGAGDGTFTLGATLTASSSCDGISVGDLNGDTNLDIVAYQAIASNSGAYGVALGNGNGTFGTLSYTAVSTYANWGHLALLNNDANLDLVIGSAINSGVLVLLGNGNGTFGTPTTVSGVGSTNEIRAADVNGDGNLDLVVAAQSDGIGIALGSASGTFGTFTNTSVGTGEYALTVCDLNNDNKWDVVCANISSDDVGILIGD
ncbi:MAG: VCBS repeat-containing protein [Planctomycetes bacterium]|nr:VCBS repeat-containing protein [Planctomycetota bacterium]